MDGIFVLTCAVLLAMLDIASSGESQAVRDCGGQHVCTTLMRYRDGTTVDEGDNCICRDGLACSKTWDETHGDQSLTWQHYERAHWSVQYRFCTRVFQDKNICRPGEMAAIVETDVNKWEPFVSNPRCVCENDVTFKIMGWKREGQSWKYFYHCEKDECRDPSQTLNDKSVCAKIYVDTRKYTDKVLEVQFLCNCPDGYLCPAKFDEKADNSRITSDETGDYVTKECETIKKKKGGSV
ncbi:U-scoloptoxin(11)-Sm7a-like [Physella acuta]|uniref:U-scoloptoxin(11)-Sm7a-like n=1 Tax=Physella acuta TaxID=109671 RepID=UPI0027DE2F72|nr:U-scoloptoxin(11)-Sm7a-like [Physella acuta]XP_059171055.1 U-scoloptoxin(11)-Sm7a-like [Physella acuta]XP_059171056.1 U-scoloptoxin(11)-Sm7a-like [Physella acuta]